MSVTKSIPAPERPADVYVYRPLSVLALVSVCLAGLYAAVLVVLGGVAFFTGQPLPLGTGSLALPAVAAVLALIARQQIRNSEGTRSGLALANWGWWLSVLFGLGYAAFYIATFLALSFQAQGFVNQWVELVKKGDPTSVNAAFLLTQEPDQREGDNPADAQRLWVRYGVNPMGKAGALPMFREHELVRILRQGGPDLTITEVGVNNWGHDKTGYRFVQTYRVRTREGEFDFRLAVHSKDRKVRLWQLLWTDGETGFIGQPRFTELGEAIKTYRADAARFLGAWLQRRYLGDVEGLYLDTREPGERTRLTQEYQARLTAAAAAVAATGGIARPEALMARLVPLCELDLRRATYFPGLETFLAGGLVHSDRLNAERKFKDDIIRGVQGMFRRGSAIQTRPSESAGLPESVDPAKGGMRIHQMVGFAYHDPADRRPAPKYAGVAEVTVESDAGPISTRRTPQWRVVRIDLVQGGEPPTDPRQMMRSMGGPGGMPNPEPPPR
jgi:hypothetical protein